jgi:PadR family transcriptional regulator PadR
LEQPVSTRAGSRKDLFPGALEMMILQVLRQQPLHGYGLVQHIKQASNDLLRVEEGSLYPALQRLLKAGWVTARWGTSASGRRVRTYQLTPAGRKHLEREVSSFEQMLEGIRLVLTPVKP